MQTVALQTQSILAKSFGFTSIGSRLMLEVLRFGKELNNFKVVVAAQEDQLPILIKSTFATVVNTILRQFVTDSKRGGAIFTGQTDRSVTLSVRSAFITTVTVFSRLLAIRLERILSGQLQTGKTRSLVDNHVVIT